MKLPSTKGVITEYGDQDHAQVAEETTTSGKINVHNLNKEKPEYKEPSLDEPEQQIWAKLAEETKKVPLFKGNTNKKVVISARQKN